MSGHIAESYATWVFIWLITGVDVPYSVQARKLTEMPDMPIRYYLTSYVHTQDIPVQNHDVDLCHVTMVV